jgi:hypothetical protein
MWRREEVGEWMVDKGTCQAIQFKFQGREGYSGAHMRWCALAKFFGCPIQILEARRLEVVHHKAWCATTNSFCLNFFHENYQLKKLLFYFLF